MSAAAAATSFSCKKSGLLVFHLSGGHDPLPERERNAPHVYGGLEMGAMRMEAVLNLPMASRSADGDGDLVRGEGDGVVDAFIVGGVVIAATAFAIYSSS